MALHGLEGHVQGLGDLAVRAALGGQARHAQLAGRERFEPCAPIAAGPCPGRLQLLAGTGGQGSGAAARGEVERFGQRLASCRAVA